MIGGIYEILNTVNGHRYVGHTSNFARRWREHRNALRRNGRRTRILQNAWNKDGEAAFRFNVLMLCENTDLVKYEQMHMDGLAPEYNLAPAAGSCLGVKMSAEARARMSIIRTGMRYPNRQRMAAETKARISASKLGVRHARPRSAEHCQKISRNLKGRVLSAERCAAMARGQTGTRRSAQTREKMRISQSARRARESNRSELNG